MYYVARISGGMASAVAADRAIQRYGRSKVLLRFEDVSWEDEDNYRFIADCMKRWGGRLYGTKDGRTPLDVFEAKQLIPNGAMAPCSYELKLRPFETWLWKAPKPLTVLMGLGWQEQHRIKRIRHYHRHAGAWRAPQGFARRIPGVYEDFPLLWKPLEYRPMNEVVRSWGIEPPRMYQHGFPHANCGGRCIKQGVSEWRRLWAVWPERFVQMRDWEQAQRAKGGARAEAAICRTRHGGESQPITLAELEQAWQIEGGNQPPLFEMTEDQSACFCTDGAWGEEVVQHQG
jgi:3'-phosphoadenosine 5'-phosphosulfate sulfotransferase (PAPS reductase)/FAD synthetase